ncbi:hypothetical protein [Fulvivirga ligni]|uniref:hypothetical protein n=1 Tax=Fulvivirga ligni TaxID=2904246 RepID=UPI001F347ACA|nr:hypothetical protein [Fulvivirga ligni]UII22891.1 hypothetical protein LVD16_06605 [Fulvivirga ligni]
MSVTINGVQLLENVVFNSGFSTGSVPNTYIIYENGKLKTRQDQNVNEIELSIGNQLTLELKVSDKDNLFNLSLSKGRIIIVDACQSKLSVTQHRKTVTFE